MVNLEKRIIEAATASFAQFGYKATTMDQVARIANVGKGTIYTFFASKEALFEHILNTLIEDMKHVAEDAIVPGDSFFVNLERALRRLLAFRKQHELLLKLAQEARHLGTSAVQDGLEHVERAIVGYLQHHLDLGVTNGDVKPCNTGLVAFLMFRTYTSMVTDWETRHQTLSDEELMHTFHCVFADGLNQH